MLAYAIRRVLVAIPIFFGITALIWIISTTNPDGGPVASLIGRQSAKSITNAQLLAYEHVLGLDKPIPVRYLIWVGNFFKGDFGTSDSSHQPVIDMMEFRVVPTLLLMITSFLLQELIAIPLGVYSAVRRGSVFDQVATVLTYATAAFPTFWLGLIAIIIFGVELHWLPFNGMVTIGGLNAYQFGTPGYWAYFHANTIPAILDVAGHMVLPVSILAIVGMAGDARFSRAQMLEVLGQDYLRTAKAKGVSQRSQIWKHALRNAVLPLITNIGLQLPLLLGGAIVTETIFSWPGLGFMYITAALGYDYPVELAYLVILGGLVLVFNILTDLSYALVDPRIRYS
jgi:peptide/nickel transport system permease protein